jgi:DNA-binding transcriptional LysR family regulator
VDTVKCEALLHSVDGGSFSAAAERMGYTPSGITRMIDALEVEVGFPLVNRKRSGVTPTKEGTDLMPLIRAFVQSGKNIAEHAATIKGLVEGNIAIGTYFSIAAQWLPSVIRAFQDDHPGVSISMVEAGNAELAHLMAESRIDCCFTNRRLATGDWVPLAKDSIVAWIPTDWPEAELDAFPLDQMENKPFIMPLPGNKNDVETLIAEHRIHVDERFTANDGYTAWRMVEQGLGMSLNNYLMGCTWQGDVRVMPLDPPQEIELGISVPYLQAASPATRAFIEYATRIVPTL